MTTADAPDTAHPSPVFVDLDGTLIRSDLLWECLRLLAQAHPLELLGRAPLWLLEGKAAFKARLAERAVPDPSHLPYRPEVVDYLERQRAAGREVVLASASDEAWVRPVADHLGLFDDVLASDGETNLAGSAKLGAILERVGDGEFEYLGNSSADLPIWGRSRIRTLVAPTRGARRGADDDHLLLVPPDPVGRPLLKLLRPHQWAKNVLLFAPLLLAHQLADGTRLLATALAFLCFCGVASAGYVINDLFDMDADRQHPTKHRRPLAAGLVPIPLAVALAGVLLLGSIGVSSLLLSGATTLMLLGYLALTFGYSLYFKRQLFVDVLVLAGLYTHRVLTGGVAADVPVSPWLLAFSGFFFLSLALVKRYVELQDARESERRDISRRAYRVDDLGLVQTMGLSCGYISVLVLCLFVSSDDVTRLYDSPGLLWLMCPVMLYWISHIWLLARRGELHEDPVLFATTDGASYLAGALVVAVVMAATW